MNSTRFAHSEGHTDICFVENSNSIITCGSEGDVRIWEGVNDVDQKDFCVGERAWAVAHKSDSVYVATDTNIVQAYTFPDFETNGIVARFTAPVTQIDLSPDGKTLVAGSCDMEVRVVNLDTLDSQVYSGHKAPVLSVCIDPKREYMATSSCDGSLRIWSLSNRDVVKQWTDVFTKTNSFESAPLLGRMHFNPSGSQLAVPLKDSVKLYDRSWVNVATFRNQGSDQEFSIAKFSNCGKLLAAGCKSGDIFIWDVLEEILLTKKQIEDKAIAGIAWNSSSTELVFCNVAGQMGSIAVTPRLASAENSEAISLGVPVIDDDDDDGENVISLEKIKGELGFGESQTGPGVDSPKKSEDDRESVRSVQYRSPISEMQAPFQPSSTPLHLQQRFMLWNNAGIIRQINDESFNDIDIEFHDTTQNHNLRVNNLLGHTMAALTDRVAVLACPSGGEVEDSPSRLQCLIMKSWDGQKEWESTMEDGESILGVAAGDFWVAAVTDSRSTVRLYSLDGTQTDLASIPGKLLSLVGYKDRLAVFYHSGIGINEDQHISYIEYRINPRTRLFSTQSASGLVPLSPGSLLRWVGYTDEGTLVTYDSTGTVRLAYKHLWRPITFLDHHCKSKFDHHFVVGVNETAQYIRCILCKGSYYPPVLPRPVVVEIKWQIPFCDLESEKSKLEEDYLRNRLTLDNLSPDAWAEDKRDVEKQISVTVLKLFAVACRSGLDARAIALCETITSIDVLNLAVKYASKMGRHQLASRVNEVAARMQQTSQTVEKEDDEDGNVDYRNESNSSAFAGNDDGGYSQSQDMFADSESPVVKENLIAKIRQQKRDNPLSSPQTLKVIKPSNPFKKSTESENNKAANLNESTSGPTFMEWFAENKTKLQEDNPLLKETELSAIGLKLFKKQQMSSSSQGSDSISSQNGGTEKRKRRTGEADDGVKPKKKPIGALAKLKSFSFNKPE